MTLIDALTPTLTLAGCALLAALLWLRRRFTRILDAQRQLVARNAEAQRDPIALLRGAWPILQRAGVQGFAWRLDWYGQRVGDEAGRRAGAPAAQRSGAVPEMAYRIALWWGPLQSENRYLAETLADTLALLLDGDLWLQRARVEEGFAQAERLRVMLLHDAKNLAQCVQLLDDQWGGSAGAPDPVAWQAARQALAAMRARADRIVQQLGYVGESAGARRIIDVRDWFEKRCAAFGLTPVIAGDAKLEADALAWATVFDNLLQNIADEARRTQRAPARVSVTIGHDGDAFSVTLQDPDAQPPAQPERLMQPFWSGSGGMGLGLTQARLAAQSQGASLRLDAERGGLRAEVRWPAP